MKVIVLGQKEDNTRANAWFNTLTRMDFKENKCIQEHTMY